MKKIERSIVLPYTAEEMFHIVNDVASYPEFISWCSDTKVVSHSDYEMIADITISKAGFNQTYRTRNSLSDSRHIQIYLLEGPVKSLSATWGFQDLDNKKGCRVIFQIQFDAGNALFDIAMAPMINGFLKSMLKSLIKRAAKLHGER